MSLFQPFKGAPPRPRSIAIACRWPKFSLINCELINWTHVQAPPALLDFGLLVAPGRYVIFEKKWNFVYQYTSILSIQMCAPQWCSIWFTQHPPRLLCIKLPKVKYMHSWIALPRGRRSPTNAFMVVHHSSIILLLYVSPLPHAPGLNTCFTP